MDEPKRADRDRHGNKREGDRERHQEKKSRRPENAGGAVNADDELREAIALSKITAQKEEAARLKSLAKATGKIKDRSGRVGSIK